jgi:hypothetical protein
MGTCYYFFRPDNETLFDMDKAYGLSELLGTDSDQVKLEDVETAILLWFGDWPERADGEVEQQAKALAAAILEFADGQPIFFISEHAAQIDALYDKYGSAFYGEQSRVTHDRYKPGYKVQR